MLFASFICQRRTSHVFGWITSSTIISVALPQQKLAHSHVNIYAAAKKEIDFFFHFALQTLHSKLCCLVSSQSPSSYRCHPDCKSGFQVFIIFDTFPFSEISLAFVLFCFFSFTDNHCLRYQYDSRFQCTGWHFASISWD